MADTNYWRNRVIENYDIPTYEELLNEGLSLVPDMVNKTQGSSLVFTALAPACHELSNYYHAMVEIFMASNMLTAIGDDVDLKAMEVGLRRNPPTPTLVIGEFKNKEGEVMDIPLDSSFTTAQGGYSATFKVISIYSNNKDYYVLESEERGILGTYGNDLLPVDNIDNLGSAKIIDVLRRGGNEETDEELKQRYFAIYTQEGRGGNIAQYRKMFSMEDGLGAFQIYPRWEKDVQYPSLDNDIIGSVLLSAVDNSYKPLTDEALKQLKEKYDPELYEGQGLGKLAIGHKLTLTTPKEEDLIVSLSLTKEEYVSWEQVMRNAISEIVEVVNKERLKWGVPDKLNQHRITITRAGIISALMKEATGVQNVENVMINYNEMDLTLPQTASLQVIPVLKDIYINGSKVWEG